MIRLSKKVRLGLYGAIIFLAGIVGSTVTGAAKDKVNTASPLTAGDFVSTAYADSVGPAPDGGPCPDPGPGCCGE